ncbi:MAG: hypothetical protein H6Q20_1477 [Bacteroidetes bacterium]|nr:hypothetical protein [Bacteroidota bacterium]
MNTKFSINRLGLLLQRFFIENAQRELTFWAISTVVFMFLHETSMEALYIFIAGFIFAARSFRAFTYTPTGMHYLLLPATHFEKLLTAIILSTFYFLAAILVTYAIGNPIGTYLGNLILGYDNTVYYGLFNLGTTETLNMLVGFITVQAIFILGSVYFKRNAVGKTILVLIALMFVAVLAEVLFVKIIFGTTNFEFHNVNFDLSDSETLFPGVKYFGEVLKYSTAPFLWIVSYFRLTEKQV